LHLKLVSWRWSIWKGVTWSRNSKVFFLLNINTHPKVGDPESWIFKVDNCWGHINVHFCNLNLQVNLYQLFMKLNLVTTFCFSQIILVNGTILRLLLRNSKFVVSENDSNGRLSGGEKHLTLCKLILKVKLKILYSYSNQCDLSKCFDIYWRLANHAFTL
jgi:hypothetical protein